MRPLISIIIPVYNRENLIAETLDSVLSQTYHNWECIIVDDGSTDNTVELLKNYSSKDKRIKLLLRPNDAIKGAPTCRNIGLFKAIGDYIIFLDSDDYLVENCLSNRVLILEKNKSDDFLVFPMGINNGETILKKNIEYKESYLIEFLSYKLPWSIMCPIWKRDFLIKLKGFKKGYPRLNDPELMIRALLVANVKFKVFNNSDYDTVYNLGISDWTLLIDKYYNSLLLFIPDICKELELSDNSNLKHLLSGYLKVWYRDFMFPNNKNLIEENKHLLLLFYNQGINSIIKTAWLFSLFYTYVILTYMRKIIKNKLIYSN